MKLSQDQEAMLEALAEADLELKSARTVAERKFRQAVDHEISKAQDRRDRLAHKAFEAGVPVIRIARDGLHTTASATAKAAIEAGRPLAAVVEIEDDSEAPAGMFSGLEVSDGSAEFTFHSGNGSAQIVRLSDGSFDASSDWNSAHDDFFSSDENVLRAAEWLENQ